MEYETRTLRIQSKDRQNPQNSTTDFQVAFGNQATAFQSRVFGISVQTVSFPNFIQTITPLQATLTGRAVNGPTPGVFEVTIPGGQIDRDELIDQLNQSAIGAAMGITWSVYAPVVGQANPYNLTMTFDPIAWAVPGEIEIKYNRDDLNYFIGIPYQDSGSSVYFSNSLSYNFRTNLNGPPQVFLHSTRLTAGRLGMDGDGPLHQHATSLTVIQPICLTVAPGFIQQFQNDSSVQRPTLAYGGPSNADLSVIDLSLRDEDQNVIDLGSGELTVVLQVWLKNR